jgi:DNA-binding PadR family transcriptional regulator
MTGRKPYDLGFLEQQVLLAIVRQHPSAYGVSISDEIKKRTGREYPLGSIYAALDRLENNGLVERRRGAPTAERGGRAKIFFHVTAPGEAALEQVLNAISSMRKDVKLKGVEIREVFP